MKKHLSLLFEPEELQNDVEAPATGDENSRFLGSFCGCKLWNCNNQHRIETD